MRFVVEFNRVSRRWIVIDQTKGDVVGTHMSQYAALEQADAEEKRSADPAARRGEPPTA